MAHQFERFSANSRSRVSHAMRVVSGVSLSALAVTAACGMTLTSRTEAVTPADLAKALPQAIASRGAVATCAKCHEFDPLFSHPVGVRPRYAPSETLPLERGEVTCLTCHDERSTRDHRRSSADDDMLLRGGLSAPELCAACHDGKTRNSGSHHASGMTRAHLHTAQGPQPQSPAGAERTRSALDSESSACLGCHDGSVAADVSSEQRPGGQRRLNSIDLGESHPIGVGFGPIKRGSAGVLRSQAELDHRVRLFDNRVGCGSCHSPYSPRPNLLVMSNERSLLCLSCHVE